MALRRKMITRVETHSLTLVRTVPRPVNLWCAACGAKTAMVTPERATEMMNTNLRAIYRQVERGQLHFVEKGTGDLLICSASLHGERRSFGKTGVNQLNQIEKQKGENHEEKTQ